MGGEKEGYSGQSARLVEEAVMEGRDRLVARSTGMLGWPEALATDREFLFFCKNLLLEVYKKNQGRSLFFLAGNLPTQVKSFVSEPQQLRS